VLLVPGAAALAMAALHVVVGPMIGFPPFVQGDQIYDTATGKVLAAIYGAAPLMATTICTFVVAGHMQEFWRGTAVRMKNAREGVLVALFELVSRAKRRYGGYIVHLGLVSMYFGFTGAAYDKDKETALKPGQSFEVSGVTVRYDKSRMEVDPNKRMIFTDMTVLDHGREVAHISPAKFIYEKPQGTATTEVAIRSTLAKDVYAIMNSVNPETKVATFRVIVRPFVAWIWLGGLIMIFGTFVSMSPSVREVLGESRERARIPAGAAAAMTAIVLAVLTSALLFALLSPRLAHAQNDTSSLHAGSVTMRNDEEKQLFSRLLCECGDCQRLPLSSCVCSWAEDMRAAIRKDLAAGKSPLDVQNDYRKRYGAKAIAIPADAGFDRALWVVPVAAISLMAVQLVRLGRRWARPQAHAVAAAAPAAGDRYEDAIDRELERMDDGA
jgi:cytochrome c-type biogenesis protein CcmF